MKRFYPLLVAPLLWWGCSFVYKRIYPQKPYLGNLAAPPEIPSLEAKTCGQCHKEIFEEWSGSLHKESWVDPLFQADRADLGAPYVCAYCHAPLGQQRPTIVTGLRSLRPLVAKEEPNPAFDEKLQGEGVSCVVCHLREGKLLSPNAPSQGAPHQIEHSPSLASAKTCKPCHFLPESFGAELRRPIIDTYCEWEEYQQKGGKESCLDCHMPAVTRVSTSGAPPKEGRRHVFLGHNNLDFVQSALRVEGVSLSLSGVGIEVSMLVQNKTGHRLPTGEPGRYLLVWVELLDTQKNVLTKQLISRIQRVVEEHGFIEGTDNTLAPKEERALRATIPGAPGAASLRLKIQYLLWDPKTKVAQNSGLSAEALTLEALSQEHPLP